LKRTEEFREVIQACHQPKKRGTFRNRILSGERERMRKQGNKMIFKRALSFGGATRGFCHEMSFIFFKGSK
jgi:hypothetical protein